MCDLCKPKRKDWSEDGFYGYSCDKCKDPNVAFIVSENHKSSITEEEKLKLNKLIEKYYPKLKSRNLNKQNAIHWFEMLVKK